MTPKLFITMVIWNSKDFLRDAVGSIAKQTDRDFGMIVVDNGSVDRGVDFLREKFPGITVIRNTQNLGFARAHNQAIAMAKTLWDRGGVREDRLILVTNPDIILSPECVARLRQAILEDAGRGSCGGKLMKISRASIAPDGSIASDMIDSTGLKIFRSRRMVDRGAGETDTGQYDQPVEIFGVSGALCLYKMDALEDVALPRISNIKYQMSNADPQFFDEAQYLYKEDVDLAWRLRLRGWKAWYEPTAVAYHYRGAYGSERRSLFKTIRERWAKPSRINFYSYRNHLLVLTKNEQWQNKLRHYPWILSYELGKLLYLILFEQKTLRAIPSFLALLPDVLRKRRFIQKNRKVSAAEIRKWFV